MRTSLRHRGVCVRRVDPQYKWAYLVTRYQDTYAHKSMQKFRSIVRCGVPQSDWVSSSVWAFPDIALAPPS